MIVYICMGNATSRTYDVVDWHGNAVSRPSLPVPQGVRCLRGIRCSSSVAGPYGRWRVTQTWLVGSGGLVVVMKRVVLDEIGPQSYV